MTSKVFINPTARHFAPELFIHKDTRDLGKKDSPPNSLALKKTPGANRGSKDNRG